MARRKAITYHLIEKLDRELPVELDPEERERLKDTENELGERVDTLEREHEQIRADEKEQARARREDIKDARAAWRKTMGERRSGTAMRTFKCELRAVIATQSIDLVRVKDGETVESRPMNEDERVKYLQGSLLPDPDPAAPTLDLSEADEPEAVEGDTLDDDECDAIGVPRGWPKAWAGRYWNVEGETTRLSSTEIAQVYISISGAGSTLDSLSGEGSPCNFLGRATIALSLHLLKRRALVVLTEEGLYFAKVEAPVEPLDPGRNDPLPEAADTTKKPKRRAAKDTGEQMINTALGQSEGHVH